MNLHLISFRNYQIAIFRPGKVAYKRLRHQCRLERRRNVGVHRGRQQKKVPWGIYFGQFLVPVAQFCIVSESINRHITADICEL